MVQSFSKQADGGKKKLVRMPHELTPVLVEIYKYMITSQNDEKKLNSTTPATTTNTTSTTTPSKTDSDLKDKETKLSNTNDELKENTKN